MPGSRWEGRGTAAHGHRDTGTRSARRVPAPPPRARRCAAPPRPARPIPPMGAGRASNAAGHWCGPARPEPIPAAPATRWRRGAEWARRARHVGAHGCSPGRAGRPRAAAPGRAHPEVAGPGRVSVRGEAPERQLLAPPCRGASLGPARSGAARGGPGRGEGCAAATPVCAGAGAGELLPWVGRHGVCVRCAQPWAECTQRSKLCLAPRAAELPPLRSARLLQGLELRAAVLRLEQTGVRALLCSSFLFPNPAFWQVEESDAGGFLAVFGLSGGSIEGFVNIPAKGYNVILVQYQRIYFADVFQHKSNKAYLSSVTQLLHLWWQFMDL